MSGSKDYQHFTVQRRRWLLVVIQSGPGIGAIQILHNNWPRCFRLPNSGLVRCHWRSVSTARGVTRGHVCRPGVACFICSYIDWEGCFRPVNNVAIILERFGGPQSILVWSEALLSYCWCSGEWWSFVRGVALGLDDCIWNLEHSRRDHWVSPVNS